VALTFSMVISQQPGTPALEEGNRMAKPNNDSGVPQGLEYLALVDHILVRQKKELFEIVTGWETRNKYIIMNE
ncbi:hypothetical protein PMAYCL1PPCAC_14436, partial [Pristionchus mayeri]